jgi:hypothetical protein
MTTRTTLILRRRWSVVAAGMLVSVFALAAPAGAQAPPTCGEQAPTIVGTNGADLLVGTPGDDVIVGNDGADVVFGLSGRDVLDGGPTEHQVGAELPVHDVVAGPTQRSPRSVTGTPPRRPGSAARPPP